MKGAPLENVKWLRDAPTIMRSQSVVDRFLRLSPAGGRVLSFIYATLPSRACAEGCNAPENFRKIGNSPCLYVYWEILQVYTENPLYMDFRPCT